MSITLDEKADDPSICGPICHVLKGLEAMVAQERFEDWLFVFGTVIASESLPTQDPYDYLFYNFAPIYKGYNPAKLALLPRGMQPIPLTQAQIEETVKAFDVDW